MSEVLVANQLSPDCVAENIRKDKIINGVVGNLVPGLWGLAKMVEMFTISTVETDGALSRSVWAAYVFETATHLNAVYTCVDNPAGNPNNIKPVVLRIDKLTWVFEKLSWEGLILATSSTPVIDSMYNDWDFIYINWSVYCNQRPPCYASKGCLQYQISTNTRTTILSQDCNNDWLCATTAFRNTTGTLMTSWPKIIWDSTVEFWGAVWIWYLPSRSLYRWISIS